MQVQYLSLFGEISRFGYLVEAFGICAIGTSNVARIKVWDIVNIRCRLLPFISGAYFA
jgi:hypothetical protein